MSLPDVDIIRDRIEHVPNIAVRMCLMTCYLYAGRVSEVVGRSSPRDQTLARGPTGQDVKLDVYDNNGKHEPCVLFNIRTAKQYKRNQPMYTEGKPRTVALPLDYEPWAKTVYEYFQRFGHRRVFFFTRQKVGMYVRNNLIFEGLKYPIDTYNKYLEKGIKESIPAHMKHYVIHALRHSRATELIDYYGFDAFNLAQYGGWTLQTQAKTTKSMNRYLAFTWRSYFPKLLKPRRT